MVANKYEVSAGIFVSLEIKIAPSGLSVSLRPTTAEGQYVPFDTTL